MTAIFIIYLNVINIAFFLIFSLFRLLEFRLLKPNESQQTDALIAAISEILWCIAEKVKVIVVLPGETPHIVHSHTYFQDSVTERV